MRLKTTRHLNCGGRARAPAPQPPVDVDQGARRGHDRRRIIHPSIRVGLFVPCVVVSGARTGPAPTSLLFFGLAAPLGHLPAVDGAARAGAADGRPRVGWSWLASGVGSAPTPTDLTRLPAGHPAPFAR